MANRNKWFAVNSLCSLLQQIISIICGLILPQMIISVFGSAVNGTIASLMQFISFITLLQGGVGTIARIAYYKSLASENSYSISVAYETVSSFFKRFGLAFLIYLLGLAAFYPLVVDTGFNYGYVFFLTLILGLSSIFEYFFGQASLLLLYSDQRGYIYSIIQIICIILSTILGIIFINIGMSIHVVKLGSAVVFVIRPIVLYLIVHKRYSIDKNVRENKDLLSQKNAALVRHIAWYVHTSTDVIVLTLFTNVLWVSVYTVHKYVVSSLSSLVASIIGNTEVVYGNMIANNEKEIMRKQIPIYDLFSKMLTTVCFFTCIILISQFVAIYTQNVADIDYYHPVFAVLLVLSEMIYCMELTYQNIYIAANHIKDTQWIAIIEACINLSLSILLVKKFGIIGVAIGTVVAMTFKSIANIIYMQKNVFRMSVMFIIKSYVVNIGAGFFSTVLFWTCFYFKVNNYLEFFIYASIVFSTLTVIVSIFNFIIFKNEMHGIVKIVKKIILKERLK